MPTVPAVHEFVNQTRKDTPMLIGHLTQFDTFTKLPQERVDQLTELVLGEILENPIIDAEIRMNPKIMGILQEVVANALNGGELRGGQPRTGVRYQGGSVEYRGAGSEPRDPSGRNR